MKKTFGQIAFEEHYREVGYTCDRCVAPELWERVAAAVLAAQWRPVSEPPEDQDQFVIVSTGSRQGDGICQFKLRSLARTQYMMIPPLPPETVDPYAELKAAHAAGKVIQRKRTFYGQWVDLDKDRVKLYFEGEYNPDELRVKPWTLSRHIPGFRPLEDGEEWHRQGWTEDMLPEGWRPMLKGERREIGDGLFPTSGSSSWRDKWQAVDSTWTQPQSPADSDSFHSRTRRPLPPTKAEKERKEFEEWYSQNAFDYQSNPIGSRECGLQWKAWQAARKQKEAK